MWEGGAAFQQPGNLRGELVKTALELFFPGFARRGDATRKLLLEEVRAKAPALARGLQVAHEFFTHSRFHGHRALYTAF